MSSYPPVNAPNPAMTWARALGQVVLLSALWFVADRVARLLALPVSGGIVGLGVLVLLLLSGVVKPAWVEAGAELILANMLLYFIPLVVSVVQYTDLLEHEGLKLLVAIGVGFLSVMLVTACVVELICQRIRKRQHGKLTRVRRDRLTLGRQVSP